MDGHTHMDGRTDRRACWNSDVDAIPITKLPFSSTDLLGPEPDKSRL